ncbi:MAG TPA: hypothetical protein VH281_03245 [Gaiellaceae bacterium]
MRPIAPILAVLAVPLLAVLAIQQQQRQNEHRLAKVASEIAGRKVHVHCPGIFARLVDMSPNAGSVFFDEEGRPADFTELDEETCSTLNRFAEGKTGPQDEEEVARALHVLAHESSHLAGIRDEAVADCYGLQRTAVVAEDLGAGPAEAEELARVAAAERAVTAPPEYRSTECHDGGALDLDPGSPVWP